MRLFILLLSLITVSCSYKTTKPYSLGTCYQYTAEGSSLQFEVVWVKENRRLFLLETGQLFEGTTEQLDIMLGQQKVHKSNCTVFTD